MNASSEVNPGRRTYLKFSTLSWQSSVISTVPVTCVAQQTIFQHPKIFTVTLNGKASNIRTSCARVLSSPTIEGQPDPLTAASERELTSIPIDVYEDTLVWSKNQRLFQIKLKSKRNAPYPTRKSVKPPTKKDLNMLLIWEPTFRFARIP
jgi:hypothetical protein